MSMTHLQRKWFRMFITRINLLILPQFLFQRVREIHSHFRMMMILVSLMDIFLIWQLKRGLTNWWLPINKFMDTHKWKKWRLFHASTKCCARKLRLLELWSRGKRWPERWKDSRCQCMPNRMQWNPLWMLARRWLLGLRNAGENRRKHNTHKCNQFKCNQCLIKEVSNSNHKV